MAETIVTKITLKIICGAIDLEELLKQKNKSIELMDVYGLARKVLPEESHLGPYIKFRGAFKAVNLQTGEAVQSGALILPGMAEELLAGAFSDDTTEVKFGFRIGVKYAPDTAAKYTYTVVSLTSPAENDPIVALENQIKSDFAKLTAPKAQKAA